MTNEEADHSALAGGGVEEGGDVEAAQVTMGSVTAAESGGEVPMTDEEEEKLIQQPNEVDIPISKKLFTDKQLYSMSLWAISISVLIESINNTVRKWLLLWNFVSFFTR